MIWAPSPEVAVNSPFSLCLESVFAERTSKTWAFPLFSWVLLTLTLAPWAFGAGRQAGWDCPGEAGKPFCREGFWSCFLVGKPHQPWLTVGPYSTWGLWSGLMMTLRVARIQFLSLLSPLHSWKGAGKTRSHAYLMPAWCVLISPNNLWISQTPHTWWENPECQ